MYLSEFLYGIYKVIQNMLSYLGRFSSDDQLYVRFNEWLPSWFTCLLSVSVVF